MGIGSGLLRQSAARRSTGGGLRFLKVKRSDARSHTLWMVLSALERTPRDEAAFVRSSAPASAIRLSPLDAASGPRLIAARLLSSMVQYY